VSVRVEVVCVNPDGSEQRREVLAIEDRELAMETLGLALSEGKALLAGVQAVAIAHQVHEYVEQRRVCPHCRCRYTSKDSGAILVSTVFGPADAQFHEHRDQKLSGYALRTYAGYGLLVAGGQPNKTAHSQIRLQVSS